MDPTRIWLTSFQIPQCYSCCLGVTGALVGAVTSDRFKYNSDFLRLLEVGTIGVGKTGTIKLLQLGGRKPIILLCKPFAMKSVIANVILLFELQFCIKV